MPAPETLERFWSGRAGVRRLPFGRRKAGGNGARRNTLNATCPPGLICRRESIQTGPPREAVAALDDVKRWLCGCFSGAGCFGGVPPRCLSPQGERGRLKFPLPLGRGLGEGVLHTLRLTRQAASFRSGRERQLFVQIHTGAPYGPDARRLSSALVWRRCLREQRRILSLQFGPGGPELKVTTVNGQVAGSTCEHRMLA